MRLLKLSDDGSFSLSQFPQDRFPPYAILSHTWGRGDDDEVTFKDLVDGTGQDKIGFQKLRFCGCQAKDDDLHYFWVDTCCIDKSNNNELTTAINSMFRWYQDAARCYVYLSDVSVRSRDGTVLHVEWESAFRNSRWFKRGWTLQELLAPKVVDFYSRDEIRLGDKQSLGEEIVRITEIPREALQGLSLSKFAVEDRFSWIEMRQTTIREDMAYCLLGIFGVFLPLIYGEGQPNALRRLLREIRESVDVLPQPTRGVSAPDSDTEDIYVAVMGPIGSGKTSLIDLIVGPKADSMGPVPHSFLGADSGTVASETIECRSFMYEEGLRVNLVDFPGFDQSGATISRAVASWLELAYNSSAQLCGIIYLHRITDAIMKGAPSKSLSRMKKICGPESYPHMIIASTCWYNVKLGVGAAREKKLMEGKKFWGPICKGGSSVMRHSGSRYSAMTILERILRGRRPFTLQIQGELVADARLRLASEWIKSLSSKKQV
ncbi:putative vegetative incompatibility protein HET-E-1 [Rhexocercosporidium sp. MPI-PUGE-AT-0058]|nr:putative vegetative incompatibility protein HET-E-1 [Rhexocercosporidium sp. MPI-PUGE-AT-0058]